MNYKETQSLGRIFIRVQYGKLFIDVHGITFVVPPSCFVCTCTGVAIVSINCAKLSTINRRKIICTFQSVSCNCQPSLSVPTLN